MNTSNSKYADLNNAEVEIISINRGWYTILLGDGKTKKVRNADLTDIRGTSKLDEVREEVASFLAQGEGSPDSKLVSGNVAAAIAEQEKYSQVDVVAQAQDKNHPDGYIRESGTFGCGICGEEFMSGQALADHKAAEHEVVAPRPGSLAASLLARETNATKGIELCHKSSGKAAKKEPRVLKVNPFNLDKCPKCNSPELYHGRTTSEGIVVDEDRVVGCHHCEWEVSKVSSKPKLEPKLERYVVGKGTTASGRQTIDRDDYVAIILRGMSLDDIYAYVVNVMVELNIEFIGTGSRRMETGEADFRARYGHLNLGMQRMNLGNVLRGVMGRTGLTKLPHAK